MEARQALESRRPPRSRQLQRRLRIEEPAGAAPAGSGRGRAEAAGVREPVRQQRRPEPPAGGRATRQRRRNAAATCGESARTSRAAVDRRDRRRRRARDTRRDERCRVTRQCSPTTGTAVEPADRAADVAATGTHARRARTRSAPPVRCIALLEGTVIDTVLTNRLDGSRAAPVNCLVTNPVYSHSGQHVLIPAGAACSAKRDRCRPGRDTARGRVPPAADARRPHLPPRPVHGAEPDRRCRPARPREPPLLVDVRRSGCGRPDQRPRAVARHRRLRVATATAPSSSPAARRRDGAGQRCRS